MQGSNVAVTRPPFAMTVWVEIDTFVSPDNHGKDSKVNINFNMSTFFPNAKILDSPYWAHFFY